MRNLLRFISHAARSQLHFWLVAIPLTIVMTWPTVTYVFDSDVIRIPTRNYDAWMKVWDAWHLGRALAGEAQLFHSDTLFYPGGLPLAYQNFSLPHMLALGLLQSVLPLGSAYCLAYLLIVITVAWSAYICLAYFMRDRWLALLGAVIFGFSQHVVMHAPHPDVNFILTLPLSIYLFQRGLDEQRWRWIIACGVAVGFTAFLSVYILICALLALSFFVLASMFVRWRERRFWLMLIGLGIIIALTAAPRLYPMLEQQNLGDALDKNVAAETGNEFLAYLVNYQQPMLSPLLTTLYDANPPLFLPQTSYLGYVPLLLVAVGLLRPAHRRRVAFWLLMALPFLLLRLGSALRFDNVVYADFVLPKAILDDLLPLLFKPFHATDHFQMGVLLPLAMMACYGLKSVAGALDGRRRAALVLVCIALIAFEYRGIPATRVMRSDELAFVDWLRDEPRQDQIRLINLPMGRQASKTYALHQTLTGYPHAEGLTGRTPPEAYRYIESNLLLRAWNDRRSIFCTPLNAAAFEADWRQLQDDGFTHVLWHRGIHEANRVAAGLRDAPAAYADEYVRVYRLPAMLGSCSNTSTLAPDVREGLQGDWLANAVIPETAQAALLSVESADDTPTADGAVLLGQHDAITLTPAHLVAGDAADGEPDETVTATSVLDANSVIVLVYQPGHSAAEVVDAYRAWVGRSFESCGRFLNGADLVAEYFLRRGYPCALGIAEAPTAARYDNGLELANATLGRDGAALKLYVMWRALPREPHAFSLQVFDEAGERAAGVDFTFHYEALSQGAVDLSALPPGDYSVRLIVYNFRTGVSSGGARMADGTRFERELALGQITID